MIRIVLEYVGSSEADVKRISRVIDDILKENNMDTSRMTAEFVHDDTRVTSGRR